MTTDADPSEPIAAPEPQAAPPGDARSASAEPTVPAPGAPAGAPTRKRPLIERLGMAVIALVLAALFAVVAVAAFAGGEPFLGVMGAIGVLMVTWVGLLTLVRG